MLYACASIAARILVGRCLDWFMSSPLNAARTLPESWPLNIIQTQCSSNTSNVTPMSRVYQEYYKNGPPIGIDCYRGVQTVHYLLRNAQNWYSLCWQRFATKSKCWEIQIWLDVRCFLFPSIHPRAWLYGSHASSGRWDVFTRTHIRGRSGYWLWFWEWSLINITWREYRVKVQMSLDSKPSI